MEQIRTIPREMLGIIPKFDGDARLLNLFVAKAEYVIDAFRSRDENAAQDTYVFHAITGRLIGKAAHLISERQEIVNWTDLKRVFTQHFGDPRSEECIAIELENLKIHPGESFLDFCHRIQNVKCTLFSKVNVIEPDFMRAPKRVIYDKMALNVFLYNLPEDMIRIVRLHDCDSLEDALSVVMEEVNFLNQYHAKNKNRQNYAPKTTQYNTSPVPNFKPVFPQNKFLGQTPKFGQPQNQGFKFGIPYQHQTPPQAQGYRFGIPQNQTPRAILPYQNMQPQHRPFMPYNQPRFNSYHPANRPQFKYGIPPAYQQMQGQRPQGPQTPKFDNDVSMRTAPHHNPTVAPRTANNLFYTEMAYQPEYPAEYLYNMMEGNNEIDQYPDADTVEFPVDECAAFESQAQDYAQASETENFQPQASKTDPQK